MGKLQKIIRNNGSVIHSVNLPKEELEKLNWEKGDSLKVRAEPCINPKFLTICKENP